ncbi:pre-mRNA-splicing factor CWC22 [Babesia microti strain RI]|uniref:Pre-mRNA-splicing factor CWC22 n=1 Tax=Babesia microti (strain RI) TaxID=1133968 RepID=A0A0K3AS02_BABMR|nr:pre-mRNA-splicing factor CWC22 [Babesia microti strain RI]CTQ41240.1 pre-mRNA-splicing factor CWC22 [Babesia microti strain RI]|eukprot:XP_012649251.1 pre-mRNA-splicing factor CWC22 [Babesia microti strain RI]
MAESSTNDRNKHSRQEDDTLGRTGGIYIPPFKLARLQKTIKDTNSVEYQKQAWEHLKKRINSAVNKISISNIVDIVEELLGCNLIRGRGIFARIIIRAQMASPGFTHIYAALLAVINSKLPSLGELVLRRVILHFRRAYKRNDKLTSLSCAKLIAHLANQRVAHEIMALQFCAILLENATDDSVELAVGFLIEVGQLLSDTCKKGFDSIFERLKVILQEGEIDKRTQYTIEKLWEIRRKNFDEYPTILPELSLVDLADQITHEIDFLDPEIIAEEMLNVFQPTDPIQYEKEDIKWKGLVRELLGDKASEDSDASSTDSELAQEDEEDETNEKGEKMEITDCTEQDVINLRKTIYLCIMSSLNFEECVHKLLKLNIKSGQEIEVCTMLIDCCSIERTFQTFFALQAERLAILKPEYCECFQECFVKQYALVHRLETAKLRNVARFFTHLLYKDAIPWTVLKTIELGENSTTSSGRIFIKIIFQELCHHMGLPALDARLHEPELQDSLAGLFPTDHPNNTRFSINFFTAIGLGALTLRLRALLQS